MILNDAEHANRLQRTRALLLGVLLFGALLQTADLLVAEHWSEAVRQLALPLLGAIAVSCIAVWVRPFPWVLHLFRLLMVASMIAGGVGMVLHFRSNAIAERELDPTLDGPALVDAALDGPHPALAPGLLVQLGLLGLVAVYGHPGVRTVD